MAMSREYWVDTWVDAVGIDGRTQHDGHAASIDPHRYARAFCVREGMEGTMDVEAVKLGDGLVRWTYSSNWDSFDVEPYHVTLIAEFVE